MPRHLIPKPPSMKGKLSSISAETVLDGNIPENGTANPYLKFNDIYQSSKTQYDDPIAVQWSNILNICTKTMADIIEKNPILLSLSNNLDHIIQVSKYLTKRFGNESIMRQMILKEPKLLLYNINSLEERINVVINMLFDKIGNNINNECESVQQRQFENKLNIILNAICKEPKILCENELTMEQNTIPRLLLLTKYLNNIELTSLLTVNPSIITMDFCKLIRIVFLKFIRDSQDPTDSESPVSANEKFQENSQILENSEMSKNEDKLLKILNEQLGVCDMNQLNLEHLNDDFFQEFPNILNQILLEMRNCELMTILNWDSSMMQKILPEYNQWLYDQIDSSYYVNPLSLNDCAVGIESNENNKTRVKLVDGNKSKTDCDNNETENVDSDLNYHNLPSTHVLENLAGEAIRILLCQETIFG